MPAVTPETNPLPDPMVATEVVLLVHAPPASASVSAVVEPAHTVGTPVIVEGRGSTVTGIEVKHPVANA